ncbi:MAG: UbiA family prenyltransferase [Actinocatenispora sp.]
MVTLLDRPTVGRRLLDVWALGRPWFWPVSLLPYAVGVLLATHRLVPAPAQWPRLAVGAVVAGPLVWLAVLAVNDAHDLAGDLRNPRKAGGPLTSGRMSTRTARHVSVAAGAAAVLTALAVGVQFSLGTVAVLALGWAYSAPPLRLKARPGADVAVNAIAVGAMGPLAGFTAVQSIAGFPWPIALQGTLVGAALYLPTTLVDYRSDLASGYDTIAVRWGPRRTYLLGLALWSAAAVLSVLLAATDTVIPRRMLPFEAVMVPGLVLAYHLILRRIRAFRGIVLLSFLFLVPSGVFALVYTGIL